jgi:hypothetical protein
MFAPLIARPKAESCRVNRFAPTCSTPVQHYASDADEQALMLQRTVGNQAVLRLLARSHGQQSGAGLSVRPLTGPVDALVQRTFERGVGAEKSAADEAVLQQEDPDKSVPHHEDAEKLGPCGDHACVACAGEKDKDDKETSTSKDKSSTLQKESVESEGGHCNCPSCAHGAAHAHDQAAAPAQDAATYTFNSRGSYGDTTPGFTRPSCAATATGTATLAAGSAAPVVTVYPSGTYQVTRNDGVVKTATCTRLAAGLAATRAHENHHAAGARAAVTAANTNQGLPKNFATQADCAAALPGVLTPWNASVDAAWANEVAHGPGTNPPTAQTFNEENAAGTCTFS